MILGAGYIGLEFASYYNNFGAQVTVIQKGSVFLPKEDREMAAAVKGHLENRAFTFWKKQMFFGWKMRKKRPLFM